MGGGSQDPDPQWSVFQEPDCGGDGAVRNRALGTGLRGSALGEDAALGTWAPGGT